MGARNGAVAAEAVGEVEGVEVEGGEEGSAAEEVVALAGGGTTAAVEVAAAGTGEEAAGARASAGGTVGTGLRSGIAGRASGCRILRSFSRKNHNSSSVLCRPAITRYKNHEKGQSYRPLDINSSLTLFRLARDGLIVWKASSSHWRRVRMRSLLAMSGNFGSVGRGRG